MNHPSDLQGQERPASAAEYAGRHTRPRRGLGGAQPCPRLPRWTRPKQPQRAPAVGPGAHARMRICANSGALAPRDPAIRGHRYQAAPGDGASAAVARDGGRAHCPLWVVQQGHDGCDQSGIDHRLYTNKGIVSGLWSGRYSVERFICPESAFDSEQNTCNFTGIGRGFRGVWHLTAARYLHVCMPGTVPGRYPE